MLPEFAMCRVDKESFVRSRWIAPLLLLAMTLFGFAAWPALPDRIETHWNLSGNADGSMGRTSAVLLLPAMTLVLWGVLLLAPRLDSGHTGDATFGSAYRLITNAVISLLAAIHVAIIANGLGWGVPVMRVILVGAGLEIALIGSQLGRLRPNRIAGIRTPWTLSNDEVWRRTHAAGGRLFFIVGILTAMLGLFASTRFVLIAMILSLVGVALATSVYSYLLWRKIQIGTGTSAPRRR